MWRAAKDPHCYATPLILSGQLLKEVLAAGGGEPRRAVEAMMPMEKIDIATNEAARRG